MKARVLALYLPQFHPIPENDEWWGKGFTEWTNVAKAKPLFRGHYQPKIPTELGFYDLRMSEIREQQAELAREAGIEGFCYWHYWFGNGKRLLERPFNEVLESGKPDFPFCLAWANHTWSSKTWNKEKHENTPIVLMEQQYLGVEDYTQHFYAVLPAFRDKRYVTVDGKPFFMIYAPLGFKDVKTFMKVWRELANKEGLKGVHFVGISSVTFRDFETGKLRKSPTTEKEANDYLLKIGFDAVASNGMTRANVKNQGLIKIYLKGIIKKMGFNIVDKIKQKDINRYLFTDEDKRENVYPIILPNYDRCPRTNKDIFYYDSTPKVFEESIKDCITYLKNKQDDHKIVVLKSWNEWGEGNYVEPDIKYGRGYIEALKNVLKG